MSSAIDPTKPTAVLALTADVRANFAAAKSEIEALQGFEDDGPYLPTEGGNVTGPINIVSTGGTVSRSVQDRFSDTENVLDYGAQKGTGFDSAPAFNRACAAGTDVFIPSGTYRLASQINVQSGTVVRGAADHSSILYIDQSFDPAASGVFSLNGFEGGGPVIKDLMIYFFQPNDTVTTTTASSALGATTITVASVTGVAVGNYLRAVTASTAIPLNATVLSIAGNVVTLSTPLLAAIASGDTIRFGPSRANMLTLAQGGTCYGAGATGIKYPYAIYCPSTQCNRTRLDNLHIGGAWNGIKGTPSRMTNIEMGALNIGWDQDGENALDAVHVKGWHSWLFEMTNNQVGAFNTHHDGSVIAWNIGRIDGLNATGISLVDAKFVATANAAGGGVPWLIQGLMLDGNHANLEVSAGLLRISGFYRNGSALPGFFPVNIMGGNVTISNYWLAAGGAIPMVSVSGGVATFTGGSINMASAGTSIFTQSGGTMAIVGTYFSMPTTITAPAISQTAGAIIVHACSAHVGAGGAAVAIGQDGNANSVVGNDFPGYTITIPAAPTAGNYQLAAYNGLWGSQLALGGVGQSGRLDFRRFSDGAPTAWLGFDGATSTHVRLKNQSGSGNMIFDTANVFSWAIGGVQYKTSASTYGQQMVLGMTGQGGRVDFCRGTDGVATGWAGMAGAASTTLDITNLSGSGQVRLNAAAGGADVFLIGSTEYGRVDINELGIAKTAPSGAPGATQARLSFVTGTNAGTGKLVAYCGTSNTPVTIMDNIGAGF